MLAKEHKKYGDNSTHFSYAPMDSGTRLENYQDSAKIFLGHSFS